MTFDDWRQNRPLRIAIKRRYPTVRIDDGSDQKFLRSLQGKTEGELWEKLSAHACAPGWKREAIRRAIRKLGGEA